MRKAFHLGTAQGANGTKSCQNRAQDPSWKIADFKWKKTQNKTKTPQKTGKDELENGSDKCLQFFHRLIDKQCYSMRVT